MDNNELTHWGVRGMKWGVRRYQNSDGTLTPAGKKRYKKEMDKLKKEERVLKNKQKTKAMIDKLEAKRRDVERLKGKEVDESKPAKKTVKNLSNDELRELVTRLELEKRYRDLSPKDVSKGKKFVDDVLVPSATNSGRQLLTEYMTKVGKKTLGLSPKNSKYETPDSLKELEDIVKKLNLEKRLKELQNDK